MERWRRLLLAAALLLAALAPAEATTLEESAATALATRPDLAERQALAEAAAAAVDAAMAPYLPTLDLSAFAGGRYDGALLFQGEVALVGRQLLFDGFGTEAGVEAAEAQLAGQRGEVRASAELILLEAVRSHLNVLRNEALARVSTENLEVHRRLFAQVRQLANGGRLTEADVAQAATRVSLAEADLAGRLGELAVAVANYVAVVGRTPDALAEASLPLSWRPASESEAVEAALANHPSIAVAAALVDERSAETREAESAFWPQVSAVAEGTVDRNVRDLDDERAGAFLGGEVTWNLYSGGGDSARLAEAQAETAAAGHAFEEQERLVSQEAMVAFRRLIANETQFAPLNDAVAASRALVSGYRQQFDVGRRSLFDLLDAQGEHNVAALRATDLRYRLALAYYELIYAMGNLSAALGASPQGLP